MEFRGHIPDIVIKRLPIYVRALLRLQEAARDTVSSSELAVATGSTAAQIRRDLSYFGEFGKQGRGYEIEYLLEAVKQILHLDEQWRIALVGAGPLGQAVARYSRFAEQGFRITHVYDHNPDRIGARLDDLTIEDVSYMPQTIRKEEIQLAILAVPATAAQGVADTLVGAGIKAILNYAPVSIQAPDDVRVQDIDPVAALQSLTYYVTPASRRPGRISA